MRKTSLLCGDEKQKA